MDSQVPSTFISTYPPIIVRGREGGDSKKEEIYTVREAEFKDLREVAELLVKSFYSNGGGGGFFGRTNVLKELNRLQNNYHRYHTFPHSMFVVTSPTPVEEIVAFVDIDAGNSRTRHQATARGTPRPYLSDLAVDESHRGKGLGGELVDFCERIVSHGWRCSCLHLKVENTNTPAKILYSNRGYVVVEDEKLLKGVKRGQLLLFKDLSESISSIEEAEAEAEAEATATSPGPLLSAEEWSAEYNIGNGGREQVRWEEKVRFDCKSEGDSFKQSVEVLGKVLAE